MRREAEDEAGSSNPGSPKALGSGGSRLGRPDPPSRQAHPHPESGHPRARPRAGPGLSLAPLPAGGLGWAGSQCRPSGLGSVCFCCVSCLGLRRSWDAGPGGAGPASRPLSIRSTSQASCIRDPSSVAPQGCGPMQPPDSPWDSAGQAPLFLLSPLGPTSSEQIMKTGAFLLQG